jgi:hypothetical protein
MQLEKQDLHSTSTDAGTSIVIKLLHVNADSSIRCNIEFDSKLIVVSDLHEEKHDLHNTSTDAGTSIVTKLVCANADSSIRCNFEFDSNVIDVSDVQ